MGVGAIAVALVDALLSGPRAGDLTFVLSPRSARRSAGLAARHARARVAADNQAVLDESDVVILSVLPGRVTEVCAALDFRTDHVVVSVAAGWPPSLLARHVAPAVAVCQLIPLPMVVLHTGPVVLYPPVPAIVTLLQGCGDVVVLDGERDVILLSCLSAVMSTFFQLQTALVGWATTAGLPRAIAADYVTALFRGLAAEGVEARVDGSAGMAVGHETPGGFNEQVRRALTDAGMFDELARQLDDMLRTRIAPEAG